MTIKRIYEKPLKWLKDPHNLILTGIIVLALVIRLYYFFLTNHEALGWDESVYLLEAKHIAFGTPNTGWGSVRAILFPLFAALVLRIGLGEVFLHFVLVILSVISIFFIYLVGKSIFNERIGLISAFLLAVFSTDIYSTSKFLVDMPQVFFVLIAAYLFTKYYFMNGSKKLIYYVLPILFLGVMVRFTVGLFIISILIFLLIIEKKELFKKEEWYASSLLGILVFSPYLLYSWYFYGNPIKSYLSQPSIEAQVAKTSVFITYIKYFPNYMNWIFLIAFIIGTVLLIYYSIYNRKFNNSFEGRKTIFLLTWIIIPLVYFSFFVDHFEERYIMIIFPAIFIISSFTLDKLYLFLKKYNKLLSLLIIFLLLGVGGYYNLVRANEFIMYEQNFYNSYQETGEWIKENSNPQDIVFSSTIPFYTYNTGLGVYSYSTNESAFLVKVNKMKPRYIVFVQARDKHSVWLNDWIKKNPDKITPVHTYFSKDNSTIPDIIVYEFVQPTKTKPFLLNN